MKYQDLRDSALLDEIEEKCQEAIQACRETGMLLYRGVVDSIGDEKHLTIRTDRKPRDTWKRVHKLVDNWMAGNGFGARRSNSLFVTTDRRETKRYGELYVIFPLDGFTSTYFDNGKDLTIYMGGLPFDGDGPYKYVEEHIEKVMYDLSPIKDDLVGGMTSGHEIMIANTTYWARRASKWEEVIRERFLAAT